MDYAKPTRIFQVGNRREKKTISNVGEQVEMIHVIHIVFRVIFTNYQTLNEELTNLKKNRFSANYFFLSFSNWRVTKSDK